MSPCPLPCKIPPEKATPQAPYATPTCLWDNPRPWLFFIIIIIITRSPPESSLLPPPLSLQHTVLLCCLCLHLICSVLYLACPAPRPPPLKAVSLFSTSESVSTFLFIGLHTGVRSHGTRLPPMGLLRTMLSRSVHAAAKGESPSSMADPPPPF